MQKPVEDVSDYIYSDNNMNEVAYIEKVSWQGSAEDVSDQFERPVS